MKSGIWKTVRHFFSSRFQTTRVYIMNVFEVLITVIFSQLIQKPNRDLQAKQYVINNIYSLMKLSTFCFIHVHTHCQEVIQWFKSAWISRSLYHCPVPPAFIRGLRLLISVHSTPPASIRDLRLLEALHLLEVFIL